VAGRNVELTDLPVGFERFHHQAFLNYQFNRAYGLGLADRNDLYDAGLRVRSAADCVIAFETLSRRATADGRDRQALGYLRLAEFFTPPSPAKIERYRRFRALFDVAFLGDGLARHHVPYAGAVLPAYVLPATGSSSRGTVLLHGGFDSLIEEFYAIWQRIAAAGFDVVAFEGPGQGGARAVEGLTFDHDWEKPVKAVVDHFQIESAALVGLSMGGYWAIRAAGRERRIAKVVCWPPVYDWLHRVPAPLRGATRTMLRHRRFMRLSVRTRARIVPTLRHVVNHVLYLINSEDPMSAVDWFLGMNADHLGSERVTQDVLLLCGEHDSFQPPMLARAQARALTAASSVTLRIFTKAESADQHCQIGNVDLACRVLTTWLQNLGSAPDPRPPDPSARSIAAEGGHQRRSASP
jgi:pimeloyl-ACP methyl ester carboxylesterase